MTQRSGAMKKSSKRAMEAREWVNECFTVSYFNDFAIWILENLFNENFLTDERLNTYSREYLINIA